MKVNCTLRSSAAKLCNLGVPRSRGALPSIFLVSLFQPEEQRALQLWTTYTVYFVFSGIRHLMQPPFLIAVHAGATDGQPLSKLALVLYTPCMCKS